MEVDEDRRAPWRAAPRSSRRTTAKRIVERRHEDAAHDVDDADRLAGAGAADDSCRGRARRPGSSPAAAASAGAGCSRGLPSCPRRDCPTSSRRRRSSRIVSAMSPVTPKPAAEFSTLAMTKSMSCCSTSAGMARRAISRPGLPKMSPMKRMRIDQRCPPRADDRDGDRLAPLDRRCAAGRHAARRPRGSPSRGSRRRGPRSGPRTRTGRMCAPRDERPPPRWAHVSAVLRPAIDHSCRR